MELDAKIEAILFFKAEPLNIKDLSDITGEDESAINQALDLLEGKLQGRGLSLIRKDKGVSLGTNPEASNLIEKIVQDELAKELGRAALETLAIIIYEGPISRSEVDYIRGVNSSFIVRNLLIRGLVERVQDENDSRRYLYRSTFDLLQYLGLSKIEDLPEYESIQTKIEEFKQEKTESKQKHEGDTETE